MKEEEIHIFYKEELEAVWKRKGFTEGLIEGHQYTVAIQYEAEDSFLFGNIKRIRVIAPSSQWNHQSSSDAPYLFKPSFTYQDVEELLEDWEILVESLTAWFQWPLPDQVVVSEYPKETKEVV